MTKQLNSLRAKGVERNGRGVFSTNCPNSICELENSVEFDKKMVPVAKTGCMHFISHHLKPGDGVYFNFFQE